MKISLVVLIFVAFLIICQDQPEKAIGRPVGTTGNVVGPGYRYNGSLDQQNVPINQPLFLIIQLGLINLGILNM